jgi:hypothetical protein
MEFHLTYEGLLMGSGRDDPRPDHKHKLRRDFHKQLKRLWDTTWLNEMKHGIYVNAPQIDASVPMREGLAQRYAPLVRFRAKPDIEGASPNDRLLTQTRPSLW